MEQKNASAGASGPGCFFCETAIPFLERVWTDKTQGHFRNSRLEFLKGLRSLLDARINCMTEHQEPKGTHVVVE